jgi:hypothetical protein
MNDAHFTRSRAPARHHHLHLSPGRALVPALAVLGLALLVPARADAQGFIVRSGQGEQDSPATAYNERRKEFLVVYQNGENGEIEGRTVRPLSPYEKGVAQLGSPFEISDFGVPAFDGPTVEDPTVAYNPLERTYLVVWEQPNEFDNKDVMGARLDEKGVLLGEGIFTIDTGDCWADDPSVAYNPVDNQWLVVWNQDDSEYCEGYANGVNGSLVEADGATPLGVFDISNNSSDFIDENSVAYDSLKNEFLVVYEREVESEFELEFIIAAQRVKDEAADGSEIFVANEEFTPLFNPSLAYSPATGSYLVAWRNDDNGRVMARPVVGGTGSLGTTFFVSDGAGDADETEVAYTNAKGKFLVVWDDDRNPPSTENDIFAQIVNKNYTLAGQDQTVSAAPPDETLPGDTHEAVACGGSGLCLVVWTTESVFGDNDIAGRVMVVK